MNKAQTTAICREILYRYPSGYAIHESDAGFLLEVFSNHPEWGQKKGCGIERIETQDAIKGTKCFVIFRTDGTKTDISFVKCIQSKGRYADVRTACRKAIEPIIKEFKKGVSYGVDTCPISGDILNFGDTHIDHFDKTFDEVFRLWVAKYPDELLFSKLDEGRDNSFGTCFTDEKLEKDFIDFHNANTHLRAVSARANLSILKLGTKNKK